MNRLLAVQTTIATTTTTDDQVRTLRGMACGQNFGLHPSSNLINNSAINAVIVIIRKLNTGVPTTLTGCTRRGNSQSL